MHTTHTPHTTPLCIPHTLDTINIDSGRDLSLIAGSKLESIASKLTIADIGYVLYRVNGEIIDDQVYNIPGYGNVCFCGLQG